MIHSSVVRGEPQVEAVPHVEPREIGPDADLPAPEQGDGKKDRKNPQVSSLAALDCAPSFVWAAFTA